MKWAGYQHKQYVAVIVAHVKILTKRPWLSHLLRCQGRSSMQIWNWTNCQKPRKWHASHVGLKDQKGIRDSHLLVGNVSIIVMTRSLLLQPPNPTVYRDDFFGAQNGIFLLSSLTKLGIEYSIWNWTKCQRTDGTEYKLCWVERPDEHPFWRTEEKSRSATRKPEKLWETVLPTAMPATRNPRNLSWIPQPRPRGRASQIISKTDAHAVEYSRREIGATKMILLRLERIPPVKTWRKT
eukprot:scaffold4815_cov107-Cylindrotheca_fusiformis.AAC.2